MEGWSGDGRSCPDGDECATHTDDCDDNATCENSEGDFDCTCDTGFTGPGDFCVDVDECAEGSHGCDTNARCDNLEPGFSCTCGSGWTGDGLECVDFDECAWGTHDCEGEGEACENLEGSYECVCGDGWTPDEDGCVDFDECFWGTHDCDDNAICSNVGGGYTCECDLGYEGSGTSCTAITEFTFNFPTTEDTLTGAGDDGVISAIEAIYTGSRDIPLATISAVPTMNIGVDANNICPSGGGPYSFSLATVQLRINGENFGVAVLGAPGSDASFLTYEGTESEPPPVSGPPYDLEFETLYISCGSFDLSEVTTTVTVVP